MPITDSDLFLIEDTSGVSKKIAASKLKSNLASGTYDNYKLLVNKPDYSSRFVYAQNMQQSVAPTDYMLVERGGTSYKVNGQQIIDYFPSVPAGAAGAIVDIAESGIGFSTKETDAISNVNGNVLTFPTNNNFGFFIPGEVVQSSPGLISTQIFSQNVTVSNGYWSGSQGADKAFNGGYDDNDGTMYWRRGELTITFSNIFVQNKVRLVAYGRVTEIPFQVTIGGVTTTKYTTATYPFTEMDYTGSGELTLIYSTTTDDYGGLACVEVDGKILTDTDQDPNAFKLVSKAPNASPPTITVDGGKWTGSNGSGIPGEQTRLSATVQNNDQLTLAGTTNLDLFTGGDAIRMVNSDGAVASYTPVTNTITNVGGYSPSLTTNATTEPQFALDGEWETYAWRNDTITTTFSNTIIEPGHSLWVYFGKGGGEAGGVVLTLSTGSSNFDAQGLGSNIYKVYTNNGFANETLTQAVLTRPGSFAYVSAYAITPPEFTEASPIIVSSGNEKLGPYTIYTKPPAVLLSFNSPNPDLKFFNPGDVVQSGVKVISTDTTANTMNVEGGDWANGDVVTGPTKSGTGIFSDNTGAVVDLFNSNLEWISNDNRLGEEFFIKTASTRTGLAILRTKAIAAATGIAQAKEDILDGHFAIVNNNYWFRDEDTFIDLGPINLPSK